MLKFNELFILITITFIFKVDCSEVGFCEVVLRKEKKTFLSFVCFGFSYTLDIGLLRGGLTVLSVLYFGHVNHIGLVCLSV